MSSARPVEAGPWAEARIRARERGGAVLARHIVSLARSSELWPGLRMAAAQRRWFAWHDGETTIAAFGAVAGWTATDAESWHQMTGRLRAELGGSVDWLPAAVGGCSFHRRPGCGPWERWPGHELFVPERMWVTRAGRTHAVECRRVTPEGPDAPPEVLPERIGGRSVGVSWDDIESEADWIRHVEVALGQIHRGDVDKVVLARRRRVRADARVDAVASLLRFRERFPTTTVFAMGRADGSVFLGATPETLLCVDAGAVTTEALAGTLSNTQGAAADLEASAKDQSEHRWVADAVEAVLERWCRRVQRDGPRAVAVGELFHLRTRFTAELRDPASALSLVDALHPTPAVGGSPRSEAVALLEELERFDRGWFAAPVGWLAPDGGTRFAVALRSALARGGSAHAFAGAGIVADSVPQSEWAETAAKLAPATTTLAWVAGPA